MKAPELSGAASWATFLVTVLVLCKQQWESYKKKTADKEATAKADEVLRLAQAAKDLGEKTHELVNGQSADMLQVGMVAAETLYTTTPTPENKALAAEARRKFELKSAILQKEAAK